MSEPQIEPQIEEKEKEKEEEKENLLNFELEDNDDDEIQEDNKNPQDNEIQSNIKKNYSTIKPKPTESYFYEMSRYNRDTGRWNSYLEKIPISLTRDYQTIKDYLLQNNKAIEGDFRCQIVSENGRVIENTNKRFSITLPEITNLIPKKVEEMKDNSSQKEPQKETIEDILVKQVKRKQDIKTYKEIIQSDNDQGILSKVILSLIENKPNSNNNNNNQEQKTLETLLNELKQEKQQSSMIEMIRLQNEQHSQMIATMIANQKEQQNSILSIFQQTTQKEKTWENLASLAAKISSNPLIQNFLNRLNRPSETAIDKILPTIAENIFSFQTKAMETMVSTMSKQQTFTNPSEMQSKLSYYRELMGIITPALKEALSFIGRMITPQATNLQPTTNPPQEESSNITTESTINPTPQDKAQAQKEAESMLETGIRIIYTTPDPETAAKILKAKLPKFCNELLNIPKAARDTFLIQYGLDVKKVDDVCNILSNTEKTEPKPQTPISPVQTSEQHLQEKNT